MRVSSSLPYPGLIKHMLGFSLVPYAPSQIDAEPRDTENKLSVYNMGPYSIYNLGYNSTYRGERTPVTHLKGACNSIHN